MSSVSGPQQFDRFALEYDRFLALESGQAPWLGAVELGGCRALDAGCASGRDTVRLAQSFDEVIGIDVSEPLVEIARSRPHPRVEFRVADLHQFADQRRFDFIYSSTALHHVGDYAGALRHLRSLVVPGGRVLLVDNVSDRRPTPPRWTYTLDAPVRFVPDVRRIGLYDAWWLLRFRTSGAWMAHLLSDRYLSRGQFREIHGAVFPGARFVDYGFALATVWAAPG